MTAKGISTQRLRTADLERGREGERMGLEQTPGLESQLCHSLRDRRQVICFFFFLCLVFLIYKVGVIILFF